VTVDTNSHARGTATPTATQPHGCTRAGTDGQRHTAVQVGRHRPRHTQARMAHPSVLLVLSRARVRVGGGTARGKEGERFEGKRASESEGKRVRENEGKTARERQRARARSRRCSHGASGARGRTPGPTLAGTGGGYLSLSLTQSLSHERARARTAPAGPEGGHQVQGLREGPQRPVPVRVLSAWTRPSYYIIILYYILSYYIKLYHIILYIVRRQ
jgi:hypothetical protein